MILFVETSWETGSLALSIEDQIFSVEWDKKSSHSEILTTEFQALLKKADAQVQDIKKICVNVGPGSFTGVRVGLSFAKSLGYLLKVPLLAMNSLEIMAFRSQATGKILVFLPAIKGHFYVAGFERSPKNFKETISPKSLSDQELDALQINFSHLVNGSLIDSRPRSSDMVQFFQSGDATFEELSWKTINPLYLRRSEAEEKLSTGLLKPMYSEREIEIERGGQKQGD